MVKSALEIGKPRWECVWRVATTAVVCLLICGTQAIAQSPGYAVVAVDGHGAWGASLGLMNPDAAGSDAISRCGGANCRVVMIGRGRCVAFADSSSGGYWYGHAFGSNAQAVRSIAIQGCSAGAPAGTCRIKHVNCI
jgi:hypothetical protein